MRDIKACLDLNYKHAVASMVTLPRMSPKPYGERLLQALQLNGMAEPDGTPKRDARAKLAKAMGVTVQAVGDVIRGASNAFTAEKSAKAARYLRVDHYWLATGDGDPRPPGLSEEAKAFAQRFDKMNAQERDRWLLVIEVVRDGIPDKLVEEKMAEAAKKGKQQQAQADQER
jgi:transcriptional regulator with XRE-family HTH domain